MVDISFIDLVKRPGDNDAKKAASTFISGFKAAFEAFDWSICMYITLSNLLHVVDTYAPNLHSYNR